MATAKIAFLTTMKKRAVYVIGLAPPGVEVTYVDNTFDVLDRADALVICTDWDEFRHPDFDEMRQRMHSPVVFDGRNLYRHRTMREYGFVYHCVGREPVVADGVEQTS